MAHVQKLGEMVQTEQTLGFNNETIEYKSSEINFWDVGGHSRSQWQNHFNGTECLVWFVDANDRDRWGAT